MKKYLVLALLAVSLAASRLSAQGVIQFEKNSVNFGQFQESKPQRGVLTFTNTGDKPLVVQQVLPSCGCTVAQYTIDPIPPGGKGKITITYDGKGKHPGHFRKPITVRSNASNSMVRIYVEGNMLPDEKRTLK